MQLRACRRCWCVCMEAVLAVECPATCCAAPRSADLTAVAARAESAVVTARTCTGAGQRAGARRYPHLALTSLLPLCFTPCLRGLPFYLVQDSGLEPADIRTWRRKFVWFPADSQRPPFYGSCKPRWVV